MKLSFKNANILITGASSGMGKEMAAKLAEEAKSLILVARREKNLKTLEQELSRKYPDLIIYVKACDLSDMSEIKILAREIDLQIGQIDILINNAGIGHIDFLENASFEQISHMVQLNILSLTFLTRHFFPLMIERGHGGILNFSSFFGVKILPAYAAYAGTKFYVTGFTETLRAEASGTGVVVSAVFPGPVKSAFWNLPNEKLMAPPSLLFISVEKCVSDTLKGFHRGQAKIIPGIRIKLFLAFLALSPTPIERWINAGMARMLRSKTTNSIAATTDPATSLDKNRIQTMADSQTVQHDISIPK